MRQILLFLALIPFICVAQKSVKVFNYKGTINSTLHITMQISESYDFSKDCIISYLGTYYYDKIGSDLLIRGHFNPCGQGMADGNNHPVYITEFNNDNIETGHFILYDIGQKTCYGTWSNNVKTYKAILTLQ